MSASPLFFDTRSHQPPPAAPESAVSLFTPGRNCFRRARADRVGLMIDGEAYYKAFTDACLLARQSILIVGWDFHSRTCLHHGIPGVPEMLGDFLNFLVKRRRHLEIRILIWDYPMLFSKGRELSPIYGFGWRPKRRIHIRYDDSFPIGASHHQKLVVIDGALAFCGGLDLTRSRWDTSDHKPGDVRRKNIGEDAGYAPFHDAEIAVDGAAARVIEDVIRDRWESATGNALPASQVDNDPWPESLEVAVTHVDVGVARTMAPYAGSPAIGEVQQLYLDMIAAAKRYIYIENQYFTSEVLSDALAKRLAEPDGPEIVAVLRLSVHGWLEAPTMGTLRTVVLRKLRDADVHGRFHAYHPHIPDLPGGQCCDLHTKLMVVDDEWLRIGSANFANRSMGLDSECDVAIEARGEERAAGAIRLFRNRLLAEHLDVTPEVVEERIRGAGSISGAIAALTTDGRSLIPYKHLDTPSETMVALAHVADSEKPVSLDELIEGFSADRDSHSKRPLWHKLLAVVLVLAGLTALWRYTPLAEWIDAEHITQWAQQFQGNPWAMLLVVGAYTPASVLMFPRPLITLFAVAAFGAWAGLALGLTGIVLAALATYVVGYKAGRATARRIAGPRLNKISDAMRQRGLLAMTAVRLVPIAPFAVVNVVAGAINIKLWHFIVGTALGMLPGALVATVFGDQLLAGLSDGGSLNIWPILGVLVLMGGAVWATRRWLFSSASRSNKKDHDGDPPRAG